MEQFSGKAPVSLCLVALVFIPGVLSMANETSNILRHHETKPGSTQGVGQDHRAASMEQIQSAVCEAGQPCTEGEWCSPNRHVCRPCSDLQPWCHNTTTIHNLYPACERHCYEVQRRRAETCETQRHEVQEELKNRESAFQNLTEKLAREKQEKNRAFSDLDKLSKEHESAIQNLTEKLAREKQEKNKLNKEHDYKDTVIAVLIVALIAVGLYAMAVSAYLCHAHCLQTQRTQPFGNPDPDMLQVISSDESGTALLEKGKTPVEDNTRDSGLLHCGSNYHPATPPLPGDAQVVAC